MAVVDRNRSGVREPSGLPREDRWPDPCGVESCCRRLLRLRNDVCFAPTAGSGGRAHSWRAGPRLYPCRYQRKLGGDVHVALGADARHGRAKTARLAFGFLQGLLVTVLQLRVAGYSKQFESARAPRSTT